MRGLRAAISFLTRVPAGRGLDGAAVARGVPWFPVVGAAVGAAVAGAYVGGREIWPPLLAAGVAVTGGTLLTGALHEDGLADVADSLGARDPEVARRIMRDPRLGTFGVIAIVAALLLRVAALAALRPLAALLWLLAAGGVSRAWALWLATRFPAASGEGLGAGVAGAASASRLWGALAVGLGIAAAALGWWAAPAALATVAVAGGVALPAARRVGGVTGDVLGAAQQAAEIVVLLLAVGVTGTWAPPGWWV